MTAYDYVVKNLKLKFDPSADEQELLHHAIVTISALTEAKWEKLPEELQMWYNNAAEVIASGDEAMLIDIIPGMVTEELDEATEELDEATEELDEATEELDEAVEAVEEATEELDEAVEELNEAAEAVEAVAAPAKRGRKPKQEKGAKEPKVKKERGAKEPKPKGPVAALVVRELLCENMDMTLDELMTALKEKEVHMERSSAQVVHLNTIRAFQVATTVGTVKNRAGEVVLKNADL